MNVAVKNEEIAVRIHNEAVLQGKLFSRVKSEECLWTIGNSILLDNTVLEILDTVPLFSLFWLEDKIPIDV